MPYGTNLPGQTICYRTQRQVLESFSEVQSCAAQLPQTAHHALQLPYTIFGLGLAPNFLDFIYVNVTNTSAVSQSKIWPQVCKSLLFLDRTGEKGRINAFLCSRLQKALFEIRDDHAVLFRSLILLQLLFNSDAARIYSTNLTRRTYSAPEKPFKVQNMGP